MMELTDQVQMKVVPEVTEEGLEVTEVVLEDIAEAAEELVVLEDTVDLVVQVCTVKFKEILKPKKFPILNDISLNAS